MVDLEGKSPRRVIVLTQWFDPEPAYRGGEFASDLVSAGYEVEVVTGFPNYPGGRIYEGFKLKPMQKSLTKEGYLLTRLFVFPSHDKNKLGRVLNYLSFFLSATLYLTFLARRADMVYSYHPPLTTPLAAVVSKYVRKWPVVMEVQDLWPDTLSATGMVSNKRILDLVGWCVHWCFKRVNHVIVQSWGFRDTIRQRGVPENKVSAVINWANEDRTGDSSVSPNYLKRHNFRILFAGNMGPAQDLGSVIEAAAILALDRPEIGFYFLGSGVDADSLERTAREKNLPNVVFWPRVSASDVPPFLDGADALLVHLADNPLFEITIPSKTQAYLLAGRPILMCVRGDAARLIGDSESGLVVAPGKPENLVAAIRELADMTVKERETLGRNGYEFYKSRLAKTIGMSHFFEIFDDLVTTGSVRPDRGWK